MSNQPKNNRVDFLMIGAPKCATTSISSILRNHPEISFTDSVLVDFFSRQPNCLDHIDDYHQHFDFSDPTKIVGECSTSYSAYPFLSNTIHKDIYQYNPNMKLIYIIRDVVERTFSQYVHDLERGRTNESFLASLSLQPEMVFSSQYARQIKKYLEYFPPEQILVLEYENFVSNKSDFFKKIANFLTIDFGQFQDYETVYENKSWTGEKKHMKFDSLKQNLNWTKNIFPKSMISGIWNLVTKRPSVNEQTKPKITEQERQTIIELFEKDQQELKEVLTLLKQSQLNNQV